MDYTIAVVDDSAQDRVYVSALVRQWAGEKGHVAIVKEFPSAEAFLFAREDGPEADMLLLDIERVPRSNLFYSAKRPVIQNTVNPSQVLRTKIADTAPEADMLLLDIEMGAMNGVDLAKELRRGQANRAVQSAPHTEGSQEKSAGTGKNTRPASPSSLRARFSSGIRFSRGKEGSSMLQKWIDRRIEAYQSALRSAPRYSASRLKSHPPSPCRS